MSSEERVTIYTDGACSGNPGPGGWGAYLIYNGIEKEIYGYDLNTTNNKMELQAVIEALKILKRKCNINIYTDSKYVYNGITEWVKKWQRNSWVSSNKDQVKNIELWQELVSQAGKHNIIWHWVKGHSNNNGNVKADLLANKGCNEAKNLLHNI